MNIKKIKPPKYKVYYGSKRYSINEYELRQLMLDVSNGSLPAPKKLVDAKGTSTIMYNNGILKDTLYGLAICDDLAIELFRKNYNKS